MSENKAWDVAILGAGPAGLTAALYAGRAMLSVCILEGIAPGGQMANTSLIDNYPGFPKGVDGIELSTLMQKQVAEWEPEWVFGEVKGITPTERGFLVQAAESNIEARTVIIATGSRPRLLGVPGEEEYRGRGVSYCAICDGGFFRGKEVAVVGGGDSALEEALYLTKHASKVTIIHRRDEFRATQHVQQKVLKSGKIALELNAVVEKISGGDKVESLLLRSTIDGSQREIAADGVFIYVGMVPNTAFLRGLVDLDETGYIIAGEDTITSYPGIFAAGDVRTKSLRQIVTALADGAVAAMAAQHYLDSQGE